MGRKNKISSEIGKEMFIVKRALKENMNDLDINLHARQNCHGNYELSTKLVIEKKLLVEQRDRLVQRFNQLKLLMKESEKNYYLSLATL